MPFLKITSSVEVPVEKRDQLLAEASKAVAEITGKPEGYMMVTLESGLILFGGKAGPGAFVDVRAIGGLTPQVNAKISAQMCTLLQKWLNVPGDRIYLTFIDVPAGNWGHDGKTFG